MNAQNRPTDLETPAVAALAAASKTPFMTALKITLGIGLGRVLNLAIGVALLSGIYLLVKS
jgi:hypothetical protein